ncbi:hypothetical protein CH63R_11791 [Colletotrichum higginsianum IMI 349063]|uniref:Uncharacterized protein n=1 Tax=Colletotrichum higginsianum (strain IMI 349063) TaxID=759273 RepID=A0A1B7XZ80_COLHI|nr:hypothetical protein CH63R_11791 [Colletotrichum higginsianum IMI 349063]OBR05088.1 hypothetical protein CH63R_11791 [Colletotrichum higginsianum IMI 349063]
MSQAPPDFDPERSNVPESQPGECTASGLLKSNLGKTAVVSRRRRAGKAGSLGTLEDGIRWLPPVSPVQNLSGPETLVVA